MSDIKDITGTEFYELLEQVQVGKRDIVNSQVDEWQDMLEKLLVVVSAPADDTFSITGIAPPRDERCQEMSLWMDSCQTPTPLSHLWVWWLH